MFIGVLTQTVSGVIKLEVTCENDEFVKTKKIYIENITFLINFQIRYKLVSNNILTRYAFPKNHMIPYN